MLEHTAAPECTLDIEVIKIRHEKVIELDSVKRFFMGTKGKLPKAEMVASQLCLSVRTFNRYLKNSGVSYRELQEQVRKEKAADYLLTTDDSIQKISDTMGYANPSNFTKAFKIWYGMTPKAYRKSHRQFYL